MMKFHKAVTTVFGLGYAPIAPGTFGTIGAVIYYIIIYKWLSFIAPVTLIATTIVTFILGIYSTNKVSKLWGEDPSKVVIDEFVGLLITMAFIPFTWINLLLAFILFRFFDILKPLGIRYLDLNVKGGLGVMLDDVLAGIYACASLHGILYLMAKL